MLLTLVLVLVIVLLLIPAADSFTVGKGRTLRSPVRYALSTAVLFVLVTTPLVNIIFAPMLFDGDALRMGGYLVGVAYDALALIIVVIIAKKTSIPISVSPVPETSSPVPLTGTGKQSADTDSIDGSAEGTSERK